MSAAFTPGPWRFLGDDDRYEADCIPVKAGEHQVAEAYCWPTEQRPNMTIGEGEANARLIAAAPDLYEALKLAVYSGSLTETHTAIANAALAKVRGEQ